jgi:truncated hemoglobin YjbI
VTGTLTPWHSLGDTDAQRDHAVAVLTTKFYDLVLADATLLQYFGALIVRGNARLRRELPPGLDRAGLEAKLSATVAVALGKPGSLDLDALKIHLDLFNITPRHYFTMLRHFLTAGDEVGLPLDVLRVAANVWFDTAPLIVRKWAAA